MFEDSSFKIIGVLDTGVVKRFYLIALCVLPCIVNAQQIVVKGKVRETGGSTLPLANLVIFPDSILLSTDVDGNFESRLSPGVKTIRVTYTGYESLELQRNFRRDTVLEFSIKPRVDLLAEVTIQENRYSSEDAVASTSSGTITLTNQDLLTMPALLGEPDLIKAIQLLPGNVKGMDGTSDVFVRGGAADQNLVLLDGAPVYNTSYMLGFLSVFNPDVVDKVEAINGGFPAEFGGRLSSVLNVTTLSDIPDRTRISADIGLISSRVKLEQPVIKDKGSFWITGRRTYVDKVVGLFNESVPYHFYDINGKFIFHPTKTDELEFSHFTGEDRLNHFIDRNNDGDGTLNQYNSYNATQALKWNHQIPGHWSNHLLVFRTDYSYRLKNAVNDYSVSAFSNIQDIGSRFSLKKDAIWRDLSVTAGTEWVNHRINPNVVNSTGTMSEYIGNSKSEAKSTHEFAVFIQQEISLTKKLKVNSGIRTSAAVFDKEYYLYPEPRVSARYELTSNSAFKVNYSRMVQYIHRISNAAVSTPTDLWYPVTSEIKPQRSHQYSAAWQQFVPKRKIFISVEGYFKAMKDLIAYQEGTNLLFNNDFTSRLIQGQGKAYGLEMLVKKESGRFTGWISYNLAWSWRQFDDLNNGEWFHARYDRRHNGAIVAQHTLGKRWAASFVWEYISGSRFTPIIGQYMTTSPNMTGVDLIPLFADINSVKLSDSHRLDLAVKLFSHPDRKFKWTLSGGVYNTYNRATPIGIVVEEDKESGSFKYTQPGLIGFLPFVSYGCKF